MMSDVPLRLSEYEQKLIRLLGSHYDESEVFMVDQLPEDGLGRNGVLRAVERFKRYQLIEWKTNATIRILPSLLEAADKLDNPPPKDYWANIVVWFRSRPWSVPIVVVVVCLPLLFQWVEMLRTLLRWMGVMRGD